MTLAEIETLLVQSFAEAKAALGSASNHAELEAARVQFLGQKGFLQTAKKSVGQLKEVADKKAAGKLCNDKDRELQEAFQSTAKSLDEQVRKAELATRLDVTLPGRHARRGHRHPLSATCDDILAVLSGLGFQPAEGPEVEHDFYNFEALNMPKDHPARDMQDTFYVTTSTTTADGETVAGGDVVLRTHTSPVQARTMLAAGKPPIRVSCYGRVYRKDDDPTHSPMFHQIEGLYVDKEVTFADLKGTLQLFAERIFVPGTRVRLRPSFFPFTEPSVEVDISCFACGGSGHGGTSSNDDGRCRLCKATGFIEIMGAGMVDPEVFKACKLDPDAVSGFAFGIGVERVAMLRYGISDIRMLYENDGRFLAQFPS
ncbi:MAG: phenylalanine--tRNA ligase subunit alpha [Deltaproteobacteria bacterium]|nr:phenylalanine--tRNA ligase subunit alpha [Deltaproteobacteria bacterium]